MLLKRVALLRRTLQWFKGRLPHDDRTILFASVASTVHSLVSIGGEGKDTMA